LNGEIIIKTIVGKCGALSTNSKGVSSGQLWLKLQKVDKGDEVE